MSYNDRFESWKEANLKELMQDIIDKNISDNDLIDIDTGKIKHSIKQQGG